MGTSDGVEEKILGPALGTFVHAGSRALHGGRTGRAVRSVRRVSFDPHARDADADQIVQEGTTAERRIAAAVTPQRRNRHHLTPVESDVRAITSDTSGIRRSSNRAEKLGSWLGMSEEEFAKLSSLPRMEGAPPESDDPVRIVERLAADRRYPSEAARRMAQEEHPLAKLSDNPTDAEIRATIHHSTGANPAARRKLPPRKRRPTDGVTTGRPAGGRFVPRERPEAPKVERPGPILGSDGKPSTSLGIEDFAEDEQMGLNAYFGDLQRKVRERSNLEWDSLNDTEFNQRQVQKEIEEATKRMNSYRQKIADAKTPEEVRAAQLEWFRSVNTIYYLGQEHGRISGRLRVLRRRKEATDSINTGMDSNFVLDEREAALDRAEQIVSDAEQHYYYGDVGYDEAGLGTFINDAREDLNSAREKLREDRDRSETKDDLDTMGKARQAGGRAPTRQKQFDKAMRDFRSSGDRALLQDRVDDLVEELDLLGDSEAITGEGVERAVIIQRNARREWLKANIVLMTNMLAEPNG